MEPNQDPNVNPNPAPMGGVDAVTAAMNGGVATPVTPENPATPTMSAMPEMATAPAPEPVQPTVSSQPFGQPAEQPLEQSAPTPEAAPAADPTNPAGMPDSADVVAAAPESAADQLEAALNETIAPAQQSTQPAQDQQPIQPAQAASMPLPTHKKNNLVMILCAVLLVIVAIGGIAFGVIEMLNGQNAAKDYEKQISDLKSTNASLRVQLDEASETLTGDEALVMLQAAAKEQNLPYEISYANVYAKYTGDEDLVAYWVKYLPTNAANATNAADAANASEDTATTATNIIFTLNEDGEWEFTLPGFATYGPELTTDYTVITFN